MEDLSEIIERGIISAKANDILTPELAAKIGAVHGTYLPDKGILVAARDYNNNSRMLKRAYISGAMSTGNNILNLHSAPLPLVQFCIRRFGATGGVFFSSGHTYHGETAIRFFDSSGIEFSLKNMATIANLFKSNKINRVDPLNIGTLSDFMQTFEIYKKALPQFVDRKIIASAGLKVVMDCSHGPVGELAPEILNSININVIALNSYYRPLSNKVYPDLNTVRDSASIVKASKADIGVIFDTDGSRLLLLDETGTIVEFEDIFMLMVANDDSMQKNKSNPIFTTIHSSKILDEYIKNIGYNLKRLENLPGEMSRKIREERGAFGGTDTYKFYFPAYGPFSDGIFTLLKLLEIIAKKGEPLSSLSRSLPKSLKTYKTLNIETNLLNNYNLKIKDHFKNSDVLIIDTVLGLKVIFDSGWVKIIPSLYRNALILTSEAQNTKISEELISQIEGILEE